MIELTEELAACLHQAEASKAWFERRFLQLARHQIWWRPRPSTWSIGECVNHLNKTLASYLPKVEEAIERGWHESRTTRGFSQYGWHTNHVLKVLEPPVRVSHLAANPLHPLVPVERDLLVRQFYEQRKTLRRSLVPCQWPRSGGRRSRLHDSASGAEPWRDARHACRSRSPPHVGSRVGSQVSRLSTRLQAHVSGTLL